MSLEGFWSYVHADDDAEDGRIAHLARDLKKQFEMLTGEELTLFLDKDALKWGDGWRETIDESLSAVAFFVPVLTPRYFMRPECRREFQFFARRATKLGIKELVLPLHYVDVPALRNEAAGDDLVSLVTKFQWEDWRDLRFADIGSEPYRRGVGKLAARLSEVNRQVETLGSPALTADPDTTAENTLEEPLGFIDRMAASEEGMPKLVGIIEEVGKRIEEIGSILTEGAADIERANHQGMGFGARLIVARKIAVRLVEPVDRIWNLGNAYSSQLHEVDQGIRLLIPQVAIEVKENGDGREAACTFFLALRRLAAAARGGLGQAEQMAEMTVKSERLSRDLRPVLRRLKEGLTTMVEGREVTDGWVRLIESTGISCNQVSGNETEGRA